jgi:phytoene synthase
MNKKNYLAIFAKSFNWAGFFLPKKIYEDSAKLYAFCRVLDDIADAKTDLDSKVKRFDEMRSFLKKSYDTDHKEINSSNENEKIVHDVITLAKNKNVKKIILEDLVDGVASDLKKRVHIRSVKDLLIYSYRVAGTVGLMMSKILNVNDRRALKGAIDLGIAMQLTNIARDVLEDKKMNREYIKPDFENIQATLKLADMFYESSFSSIQKIPFRHKFSIIVARRIYRQIGRKILQKRNMENYEKSGKIYVNNFEKIYQTILSILDLILIYLKELEPHQRAREHVIISQEVDLDERI